jgi:site-specific DNA-methyltransferase (adenine-specific)
MVKEIKKKISFKKMINNVIEGDCLEIMKNIPDRSIHMILCDLPYGYTKNRWDSIIELNELWEQYQRIIKDNGAIVLTAQGIFSAQLMMTGKSIFKYKMIWYKSKATNFLNAKKQPLRQHEDILVFYKNQPVFNPQMTEGKPYNKGLRKDQQSSSYGTIKPVTIKSDGERFPIDVIFNEQLEKYAFIEEDLIYTVTAEVEGKVYHPTQKPVCLGRYLIRTFTKSDDLILDNTCGSGSFLVAALLEKRKFIGIEKNEDAFHHENPVDFIEICKKRLNAIDSNLFPNN